MRLLSPSLVLLAMTEVLSGQNADTNVLRSAEALDRFLQSGRYEARAFAFSGQVCQACTPSRKGFAIDDGTNIVWLVDNVHWPETYLRDGDIVNVTGQTALLGNRTVNPDCLTIDIVGHRPLPAPPERKIRDLLNDRGQPLRPVCVRGVVRDVIPDEIDHAFSNLVLTDEDASLFLSLKCEDTLWPKLRALIGAEISVNGLIRTDERFIAGISFTRHANRNLQEPTLIIAGLESIKVLSPAPADPFDVPLLDDLAPTWPNDLMTSPRRRISGLVLSAARPRGFLLRTGDGRLVNVDLADEPSPRAGTGVIAAGIPITDLYRINLTRAIWKSCDDPFPAVQPEPEPQTIESLLTDGAGHTQYRVTSFGRRIRVTGLVRSLPSPGSPEPKITLEENGHVLSAVAEPGVMPFAGIVLGARVAVSGLCLMDVESWRPGMIFPQITGVRIAVQSPGDVTTLSKPSWWTPSRLIILVAVLLAAFVVIFIWSITLRTLVARRGRELLREQTRRLTETLRVEERTRLATELHDTVAQNLSGLSLQLDAAGRLADSDPAGMKSILALTSKSLLACRRELRDCLWDLRSQALDETDMNVAIHRALTPRLGQAKLIIRFNVPRRKIADHSAHAILRILGELANNAIRHGKATTLRIAGSLDAEGIKFSCSDDGCGFDLKQVPGSSTGHFGLQGIRDRIRSFNGSLHLTSSPGKGTHAVVHLNHTPNEN